MMSEPFGDAQGRLWGTLRARYNHARTVIPILNIGDA